jgi:hypothetical protein
MVVRKFDGMKRRDLSLKRYVEVKSKIVAWLFLLCALNGKAQQKECFYLFTDRDIYASGETMLLKIFLPPEEASGIMHLDLMNLTGKRIQGVNLKIRNHQADGFIDLPDSLGSGTYLVRASARTPGILTFKEIFIANRFAIAPESSANLMRSKAFPVVPGRISDIEINGIENAYKTRSTGHFSLKLPNELLSQTLGDLFVEIVDSSLEYNAKTFLTAAKSTETHLAEKEGIILEGIVTDLATNQPSKNAVVYLTIQDSIPRFNYYLTGMDGRFYFELKDYFGKIPIVLQCFDQDTYRLLKISLSDPEGKKSELPIFESQVYPSGFQTGIQKNREAVSFQKIFGQQKLTLQQLSPPKTVSYPFYGIPTYTVNPKLFIDLPNFNEISRELLPGVKFRAYNRIPTMLVFNPVVQSFFEETPLVVLDGIPIRDLNVIKNLGTKEIDKIDVCQSERFFGNMIFPGVVAIHRSKSDYSFMPASEDLIKLNLEVIQNSSTMNVPSGKPANEPDFRQVLLWNPNIQPQQQIDFNFHTSDVQGTFRLIVRWKAKDGPVFCEERLFEVK